MLNMVVCTHAIENQPFAGHQFARERERIMAPTQEKDNSSGGFSSVRLWFPRREYREEPTHPSSHRAVKVNVAVGGERSLHISFEIAASAALGSR